jgi:hypothetical protein
MIATILESTANGAPDRGFLQQFFDNVMYHNVCSDETRLFGIIVGTLWFRSVDLRWNGVTILVYRYQSTRFTLLTKNWRRFWFRRWFGTRSDSNWMLILLDFR